MFRNFTTLGLINLILLVGCAAPGDRAPSDANSVSANTDDAIPRNEPKSRYGNPKSYEVWGKKYYVLDSAQDYEQNGLASWYGTKFHGKRTSSGEPYNMYAMTAAHKTLPIPCYVEVTNLDNDKKIIVKVNDRGPFHEGRIIDLSFAAAKKLGIASKGTGRVNVRSINTQSQPLNTEKTILPESAGGDGQIYVQLGAFGAEQNAEQLADDLRDQEFNSVRIHKIVSQKKPVYRVRIGPMPNTDVAYEVLIRLAQAGMSKARVIVD